MKNKSRFSMNLPVNHKGSPCIIDIRTNVCQEGYCVDCEKYRNWIRNPKGSQK
jgi:hypothetical protein